MKQLKDLYKDIMDRGSVRETRTGSVISVWDRKIKFDLSEGFPATTSKKLAWNSVVGELLWFLSGSTYLRDLKHYTFSESNSDKWTIWSDDQERWAKALCEQGGVEYNESTNANGYVGYLYPKQWRDFGEYTAVTKTTIRKRIGVDQIQNLIDRLISDPQRRDHLVIAWDAYNIENNLTALKPCHTGFQCYVDNDETLHLKWQQRSVDSFLGLPFNIASYALLTHLLAEWCNLKPGTVTGDLGDVHIYKNHIDAVNEYINKPEHDLPTLVLPAQATVSLDECLKLTALDFRDALGGYKHEGVIKAPLSVGM